MWFEYGGGPRSLLAHRRGGGCTQGWERILGYWSWPVGGGEVIQAAGELGLQKVPEYGSAAVLQGKEMNGEGVMVRVRTWSAAMSFASGA